MSSSEPTRSAIEVAHAFLAALAVDDLEGAVELSGHDGFRHYCAAVR